MITVSMRKGADITFGANSTETYPWVVTGATDWPTVFAGLLAFTPILSLTGNWRQSIKVTEQKAVDVWYADVTYGPVQPPDPSTWQWEYDATPESTHVTASKECIAVYPSSAADLDNCIGRTDHGIEGADILTSATVWSEQHQFWATAVPMAYGDTLSKLEATVNAASFRGYAAGRVLFLGANIKRSSKDPQWMDCSYKFRLDVQRTVTIGDITSIIIPPHHLADCMFKPEPDSKFNMTDKLKYVKVQRVYDSGDFSLLGLGS